MFQRGAVVSDRQVIYCGGLCAPRCTRYNEDAVLEVAGQLKCALAQVTFVKPRKELSLLMCTSLQLSSTLETSSTQGIICAWKNVLYASPLEQ